MVTYGYAVLLPYLILYLYNYTMLQLKVYIKLICDFV